MATPFSTPCSVATTNTYNTAGTLTRANLVRLAPTELQALFNPSSTNWHEMTALLRTQFEMEACGIKRYGMYDWIMSSNRPGMGALIQSVRRDKGPSLIQPFILGRQMSVVNDQYWAITTGYATGAYTVEVTGPLTDLTGGTRVIRVVAGYTGITLDARYFLAGKVIYILNRSGGGVAQHGAWKVISAAAAGDGTYIDVLLATQNSFDTATVDTTPITGLVLIGINNINDFEQYCLNPLNVNPVKYVPFWYQTRRRARRVDSQYKELFGKLMADNAWYAAFQDLPMAERNRQDELNDRKEFVNAFFFGRPISNAQVLEGTPHWSSLDAITSVTGATVDPGTGSQVVAYRANMVGVYEQLKACSQVLDVQNQALDIKTFLETYIYNIWRARGSAGRPNRSIDIYTDSTTASEFLAQFVAYAKSVLGDIIRMNVSEGSNEFGFTWKSYQLFNKPQGVTVNIITNEFFDDILDRFTNLSTGSQASRGRFLAVLDLGKGGSIYPAVLGSNRKTYTTGEIEQLARIDSSFACVMENPTIQTALTSETTTAIVECPLQSIWVENFSGLTLS